MFIPSDKLRPLELPFYPDGTTVCGVKTPSYDIISTRSGAAVASLAITLNQMVTHALNLHKHHMLTQTGLSYLLETLEMIEPELKIAVLSQDLALFKNIKALSRDLKTESKAVQEDKFDWDSLKVDPSNYLID